MRKTTLATLIIGLWAIPACENKEAKSPYEITIAQRTSALRIPGRIERANKLALERETKAKEKVGTLPNAVDKVSDPTDWKIILEIVEAADAAGKDGAFAAEMRDLEMGQAFFVEEKDPIAKKVGGSVQFAAKEKGCDVEAYGPVSSSMDKAIDERVEDRLKHVNDAFLIIERNEDELGKKNIPALEQMAADIAEASYTVNVAMPEAKKELEAMVKAAADAREDIKRLLDEEGAPAKGKLSASAEKSKKERLKAAGEALTKLDQVELDAKKNLEDLEQRTKALQTQYQEALNKLKDAIKAKQKPS